MSANKKPRADSVLKTLPPDRQAVIAEYLRAHSLEDTRAWLAEDGLKTSIAALSEFFSWHALEVKRQRREQAIEHWMECEKLDHPELSDEELFTRGQRKFSMISIAEEDPENWARIQATGFKKLQLSQEDRRIKLLEQKAAAFDRAQAALSEARNSKGGITPETLKRIESELKLL